MRSSRPRSRDAVWASVDTRRRNQAIREMAQRDAREAAEQARREYAKRNDTLTASLTAFATFEELCNSHESFRPSLRQDSWQGQILADEFDVAMAARGSSRRAYRS